MNEGDYEAALPLLEQAVEASSGSGSLTEAYSSYNLALTRYRLGSCDGVVDLLNRSEEVQGPRKEITRLRKDAERTCGDLRGHAGEEALVRPHLRDGDRSGGERGGRSEQRPLTGRGFRHRATRRNSRRRGP